MITQTAKNPIPPFEDRPEVRTASDLKYHVERAGREPHFFTRDTMKFFGDTMRNYGVRSCGEYWELYRRRPVKFGNKASAYFDKQTFARVFPEWAKEIT